MWLQTTLANRFCYDYSFDFIYLLLHSLWFFKVIIWTGKRRSVSFLFRPKKFKCSKLLRLLNGFIVRHALICSNNRKGIVIFSLKKCKLWEKRRHSRYTYKQRDKFKSCKFKQMIKAPLLFPRTYFLTFFLILKLFWKYFSNILKAPLLDLSSKTQICRPEELREGAFSIRPNLPI